jgi:hypothetical protein
VQCIVLIRQDSVWMNDVCATRDFPNVCRNSKLTSTGNESESSSPRHHRHRPPMA